MEKLHQTTQSRASVLLIEDEPTLARNIAILLGRDGLDVHLAGSGEAGLEQLQACRPALVLVDYNLPGIDGIEFLKRLRDVAPRVPVVMITGAGSEEVAIEALRGGVADYLKKPFELVALREVMDRVLGRPGRVRRAGGIGTALACGPAQICPGASLGVKPEAGQAGRGGCLSGASCGPAGHTPHAGQCSVKPPRGRALVGESLPMQALRKRLGKVIDADDACPEQDAPCVLITGETGTGKELVARALHEEGKRRGRPFLEINCASIPAQLLESELFGHARGAFTDARQERAGLFEAACDGTLFLDEVGELELAGQAKLLKVIEERRVRRIGSLEERTVQARVVCATSRNLDAMVRQGLFRADLYYRLRMLRIEVPALRDRLVDVALLAEHFVKQCAGRYGKQGIRLGSEALFAISANAWMGNVRELKNCIEQAVALAEARVIGVAELGLRRTARGEPLLAFPASFVAEGEANASPRQERDLLLHALQVNNRNVTRAARMLGISRDTFRYRARKHDIAA